MVTRAGIFFSVMTTDMDFWVLLVKFQNDLNWKTGILTDETNGELFGVTSSAISHGVRALSLKLKQIASREIN